MYQYSGPGSQQVNNEWNSTDYWFMMLSQQGYTACVDGRGTGFKGAAFKKVTQLQLGKYEVEDQIDAKVIGNYSFVDKSRIGIWLVVWRIYVLIAFERNDVLKWRIAVVAPVTNFMIVYTERYMQTPQENANGYDDIHQ
jgi:dipeptidyl-peptidase-4